MLARQPALGFFAPSWWEREIGTGFPRSEVQAGGVPKFHFDVNQALSSWKDVEPFLQQEARWPLQLASRLGEQTPATPLFESILYPDIGLYPAADKHILEYVINGLKLGNATVKRSAALAMGVLGANLPKDQAAVVVEALLNALKDPDSNVKRSAAYALGALGANLPKDQAAVVVEALLNALPEGRSGSDRSFLNGGACVSGYRSGA
jgi:hypothetical protein